MQASSPEAEVSFWGKLTDVCASSVVWLSPHCRRAWVAESIEVFHGAYVFNEGFSAPSRQQWWALAMSAVVTSLWEINNRLVIQL